MSGMDRNEGYGLHFPACHTLNYIKKLFGKYNLPVTEDAAGKIISLPIYPGMDDTHGKKAIDSVRKIIK